MHFLVISDIHANTAYIDSLADEFEKADGVIFAGDFATETETQKARDVLKLLLDKNDSLFAVVGNCDEPSFVEELEKHDASVQKTFVYRDGLIFTGAGGALHFTGTTPNERDELEMMSDLHLVTEAEESAWDNLVVVVHHPPFDTKLDTISNGMHVGSKEFRAFIQKYSPLVAISGHIHESANVDVLDKTTLINPGSLAEGSYGLLELQKQNGKWKVVKATVESLKK